MAEIVMSRARIDPRPTLVRRAGEGALLIAGAALFVALVASIALGAEGEPAPVASPLTDAVTALLLAALPVGLALFKAWAATEAARLARSAEDQARADAAQKAAIAEAIVAGVLAAKQAIPAAAWGGAKDAMKGVAERAGLSAPIDALVQEVKRATEGERRAVGPDGAPLEPSRPAPKNGTIDHPPYPALLLAGLSLSLLGSGCLAEPRASDRARYNAIAPEYVRYVEADPALDPDQRARRLRVVRAWELELAAGEEAK